MRQISGCLKTIIVLGMTAMLTMLPAAVHAFYEDVPEDAWYRDNVMEATAKGWFQGYDKTHFDPDGYTTRAEAAKVIYSYIYGGDMPSDEGYSYVDVSASLWYEPYVNINGIYHIIPAYGSYFEPDVYITRNDLVVAIVRASGISTEYIDESVLYQYTDWGTVAEEYRDIIAAALQHGLLSGFTDGRLKMNAPVTRAQFTAFMSRISVLEWENGSIDSEGNSYKTDKRIMSDYFYTPACTIYAGDNITLAFAHYDEDYELTYESGWKNGEIYMPTGIYRIVAKYADESHIDTAAGKLVKFNYMPSVVDYDKIFRTAAHRGGSFGAPENTISAFSLAAKKGYSYIECDVRWTSDNVPVISHDKNLGNISAGFGDISKLTFNKLRTYRFSAYKETDYAQEPVASYEEMIKLCRQKRLNPYVEIYDGESFTQERAKQLINIAKKYDMEYRITWISSYFDALMTIKETSTLPDLRLLYVCSAKNYELKWKLSELKNSTNRVGLDVDYHYLDKDYIDFIKQSGFDMECWTVDDASTAQQLINMGITGITTNKLGPY
ncbi:MAG: glycerophosphodiester phosphodiesterase family protein [Candidatus Ornithomonoglobus sp.]